MLTRFTDDLSTGGKASMLYARVRNQRDLDELAHVPGNHDCITSRLKI